MSDAQTAPDAPAPRVIPGYSATPATFKINGEDREGFRITFGQLQRSAEIVRLTLVDRFDLAEIAPNVDDRWTGMAMAARAVITLDGRHQPTACAKLRLRSVLTQLGSDGLAAVSRALAGEDAAEEAEDDPDAPLPPLPNFEVAAGTETVRGAASEVLTVTFGEPRRTMRLVRPGLGEQFDLAEIAPNGGALWSGMAMAALSVQSLDGQPGLSAPLKKADLAPLLLRLGSEGLRAINQALTATPGGAAAEPATPEAADEAFRAAVGNSSGTADLLG